jgi:monoamine oxidase
MKAAVLPKSADVVIAGAGVAGLYCAYRILKEKPRCRVVVLDKLNRVGGRLQTDLVHIRNLDGKVVEVKDEEGGMRFNQSMTELLALIHSLGMDGQIIPFGMGDDNNYFHVRGRSFTVAESKLNNNAIWSTLYSLQPQEQYKSPVDIITAVYHDLVLSNGHEVPASPTPEFWQQFRLDFKYQGVPLNEWGLWALYRAYGLSQECIQMCADTIGFSGPFYALVSAGEAYQILEDFPANPQFFALKYGFGSLPGQLQKSIEQMGGSVFLSTTVNSVARKGGKLIVESGHATGSTSIQAEKVILALPATAMQALQAASPALSGPSPEAAQLTKNISSVVPTRLSKVNLYYQRAWWRDGAEGTGPSIKNGGSFTSLPMGAVYVFDPLQAGDITGPAPLTIYSDFTNTNFWETLQSTGPKFTSPLQEKHSRERPQVMFAASQAIVKEATKQLQEMFRMISVPPPVLTSYRLWSDDHPFGFAYHQWARFANDREVMATIASPVKNVYVCNEAFSDSQGWANGSLRSANLALGPGFGIKPLPPAPAGSSLATPS